MSLYYLPKLDISNNAMPLFNASDYQYQYTVLHPKPKTDLFGNVSSVFNSNDYQQGQTALTVGTAETLYLQKTGGIMSSSVFTQPITCNEINFSGAPYSSFTSNQRGYTVIQSAPLSSVSSGAIHTAGLSTTLGIGIYMIYFNLVLTTSSSRTMSYICLSVGHTYPNYNSDISYSLNETITSSQTKALSYVSVFSNSSSTTITPFFQINLTGSLASQSYLYVVRIG